MKFSNYDHKTIEPRMLNFWKLHETVEKLRERNKKGKKFYFLEGPPYTSGHIHLGQAWNTALKDLVLRYKRMKGLNVWDRMGYDMHGLPTEQKVMAKFNLKNKEEIEKFGIKRFTSECRKFCLEVMEKMNHDFIRLGATLDFTNPYQPISKRFMEAEWWLIKRAQEKGRLYQGLRTMYWDAAAQTALAKHEIEYKQVKDTAIYVKFPSNEKQKKFFVIWTTTPWTIPLNLALMVNPELNYAEVKVGEERWVIAKNLVQEVLGKAGVKDYEIMREFKGEKLEGRSYHHPLKIKEYLPEELQRNPKLFSILSSKEYVDDSAGTGLVHCAPGCGPEDYEVGHRNQIPPFNCVDEEGRFKNFGEFTNWKAKLDDHKFIQALDEASALIAKEPYVHDYPYSERSHEPVIFRTTKQWFFKVEDLKKKMLAANKNIYWNPPAAKNAFNSWLENLRDNSITKQRYWSTAVPIWQAEDGEYIVVGSSAELEELSGQKVTEMHVPEIDQITITKDGKTYTRIPDVLDVWIDAGTASWNCLDYPENQELWEKFFPADFILEGKDQIRGWFNLLMIASFIAFDQPSFKNVFMHGFVTDVAGVKMSKSLGNIISPYELIDKHGADVLRYYMCQNNAGEDINFSWDECKVKERQLHILWNIHKLLINLAKENNLNPFQLDAEVMETSLNLEEKYIFSRLHSTINKVTNLMEEYRLNEIILPLEAFFLDLSRTYIQMIREKSVLGTEKERRAVAYTLAVVLLETVKMFSLVAPFISEAIYLNLKEEFGLEEESISHYYWPKVKKGKINLQLEQEMELVQNIIQSALNARERAGKGLRWPLSEMIVTCKDKTVLKAAARMSEILKTQTNVKVVTFAEQMPGVRVEIKPHPGNIGKMHGALSPKIIARLQKDNPQKIIEDLDKKGHYIFKIDGKKVRIVPEMLVINRTVPAGFMDALSKQGVVYINTEITTELEAEGYAREVMRQIQQLRKEAGLEKTDKINLAIIVNEKRRQRLERFAKEIKEKVGAEKIELSSGKFSREYPQQSQFTVKTENFTVGFEKV